MNKVERKEMRIKVGYVSKTSYAWVRRGQAFGQGLFLVCPYENVTGHRWTNEQMDETEAEHANKPGWATLCVIRTILEET